MTATAAAETRWPQQHAWQRSRHGVTKMLILIGYCRCSLRTTTAFHAYFSPASILSNHPIITPPELQQRPRLKFFQIMSSKNQWEDDIVISPDLSEYFKQQPTTLASSDTRTPTSSVTAAVAPLPIVSVDRVESKTEDDDEILMNEIGDSKTVAEIVTALQTTIESGSKGMIPDIMVSIQRLQRLQQEYIQNNINNCETDNDEKLILMKNPKKRSTSVKKNKGGMGKSTATTTKPVAAVQPRSSSPPSSSSRILQRFVNNVEDDEISYRLLWVGSDATISAFGTGLHKVPLARLQEVFLSIRLPPSNRKSKANTSQNRFRLTTTEVIRILGPFPNIKNTLQGICTVSASPTSSESNNVEQSGAELWDVTWDSMIDGTGKELIGRDNEDVRHVPSLHMLYGDEQIIVASIHQTDQGTTRTVSIDTMDEKQTITTPAAESLLLFVREMEMEEKLTALRVL